jgi:hypothetical protein
VEEEEEEEEEENWYSKMEGEETHGAHACCACVLTNTHAYMIECVWWLLPA